MVFAALLCAAVRQHGGTGFIVKPVQLDVDTVVAIAPAMEGGVGNQVADWRYLSIVPVDLVSNDTVWRTFLNLPRDHPLRAGVNFDTFAGPTSARDLVSHRSASVRESERKADSIEQIHHLAIDVYASAGELGEAEADLINDDVATGRYVFSLVDFLAPRSSRFLSLDQFAYDTWLPDFAALMPKIRYPWDAELVRGILVKSTMPTRTLERHLLAIKSVEDKDRATPKATMRSTFPAPPRYRVGDVLKGWTSEGDSSWVIVTGWRFMNLEDGRCSLAYHGSYSRLGADLFFCGP